MKSSTCAPSDLGTRRRLPSRSQDRQGLVVEDHITNGFGAGSCRLSAVFEWLDAPIEQWVRWTYRILADPGASDPAI